MRGRKPHSTRTRQLEGNPGKRPLNDREPQPPPVETDEVPGELAGNVAAVAEWQRLAPMLRRAHQITEADRAALIALCLEWSRYLLATREVATTGLIIASPSGYPMPNPYLSIATKALAGCNKLWPELGLTPSSRSRVQMPGGSGDEFSEFDHPRPRTPAEVKH